MEKTGGISKTAENIIAAIIAIAIIVLLLVFIGYENIKLWLFSPIIWDDPEHIHLTVLDKKETESFMELTFLAYNATSEKYPEYEFYVVSGFNTLIVSDFTNPVLMPNGFAEIRVSFSKGGSARKFFEAIEGLSVDELELEYHVKQLWSNGEMVFNQNSWLKIVIVLVLCALSAILVLGETVHNLPLRIILKVISIPGLLIIIAIGFVLAGRGGGRSGESQAAADESKKRCAAETYKKQAGHKAGALIHGNDREAAWAQSQMDKALADMVGKGRANQEYKRQASLKAGALMHGNNKEAAKIQAQMDRSMAEMIRKSDKDA